MKKQITITRVRPKRLPGLAEIRCEPGGKSAISKLTAAGFDPAMLENALRSVLLGRIARGVKISHVKGLSRKSIGFVPADLRRTAANIERILGVPSYFIAVQRFVPEVCQVPDRLRSCAEVLESVIRLVTNVARKHPQEFDPRLMSKRMFMTQIFLATGEVPFSCVADLLNAAHAAAGLERDEEASTLRHLWNAHAKKIVQVWAPLVEKVRRRDRYRKMARMMAP